MLTPLVIGLLVHANPAHAGKCDALLRKADTAKGPALSAAFGALAKCDQKLAEEHYTRFMSSAADSDSLVELSRTAITWEVWNPVWQQLGKISSYDARDEVADRIGAACTDDPKVVSFLQGAYFGLRDIDFQQWDDAFLSCTDPALLTWLEAQIAKPPDRVFDEKFNALLTIFTAKQGAAALPHLSKAAIAAAESGPYDAILMQMDASVAADLGGSMSTEDQAALENALVEVARSVDPSKARAVADRLATSGSEAAAARLLPAVYPDRVQNGGGFLYGAASIELGECKGEKSAVIHSVELTEPGRRWLILESAKTPMRAFKPKLKKCTPESGDWPVAVTPEPVTSSKEIDAWLAELEKQWADKGYDVKIAGEKSFQLN